MLRLAVLSALLLSCLAQAGDRQPLERARKELEPRKVNVVQPALSLSDALKALQEQTGNVVLDLRQTHKDNPKLKLDLKDATFWQALDDITAKARCGYSLYHDQGRLVLVDLPQRQANVAYSGMCRLAVKRVSVIKDDAGSHVCHVLLELAWEPRFEPFFLDAGAIEAEFAGYELPAGPNGARQQARPKLVNVAAAGKTKVAGQSAVEVDVRLPAPARACPAIDSLSGQFSLIGPSKMLTFRFASLKKNQEAKAMQDDVQVTCKPVQLDRKRWWFDIDITNPPGGPRFESFQAADWLANNRITLEKGASPIVPRPGDEEPGDSISGRHASIRYHFNEDLPATPEGWSVVYRTPGRIVDLPVNFALKQIPLP